RMMCPDGSIGADFVRAVEAATTWRYEEDRLVLEGRDGVAVTFTPRLEGVTWVWEGVQFMDDSSLMPDDPGRYSLTFLPDGTLAIKADCNRGAGTWSVDNETVDLEVGALTKMACPEDSLADRFVQGVNEVNSGVFRNGRLFLALPVDSGIHAFAARFAPPAGTGEEATPEA
ncbi:MAG: META domain-containing protein, partial [Chloroflexota bacterium]